MNSKYKLVYGSHRNSHCRNKKSKTLVGGCSVAVLCLATARTSCLTAVRTLPLTRRLSFPILPLGPWLSSPRRSLNTPCQPIGPGAESPMSTHLLVDFPHTPVMHHRTSRQAGIRQWPTITPLDSTEFVHLMNLTKNLLYIRLLFPFIRLVVCGRSNNNSIHACASG